MKRNSGYVAALLLTVICVGLFIFLAFTSSGVRVLNSWGFSMQTADDQTRYATRRKVEDTCRAMQASYESDRLVYEQYKNSKDEQKQEWGEQARMRANKTASTYNNYVLKNRFVWKADVPEDISYKLAFIDGEESK